MLMKTRKELKSISLLLVTLIALSSTSCASNKRKYEVIKETDPWYEVTSFVVENLYSEDVYESSYFETIGATKDSVYLMSSAQKYFSGSYKDLTEEQIADLYEQSILKYSLDGKLLEKTDFVSYKDGKLRSLMKAWLSDDKLNLLETVIDKDGQNREYLLNGEKVDTPDPSNNGYYKSTVYISDMLTTSGYTVFCVYTKEWDENTIIIEKPDGNRYELNLSTLFQYGIMSTGNLIPAGNGKVIVPVYLSQNQVYVLVDLESGSMKELKGLYGSEEAFMLEYCNGKSMSRDLHGLKFIDAENGTLTPICEYENIDASFYDVIDTQTLYVSDDASDIVLGGYDFTNLSNGISNLDSYKIMHLKRADRNPNAGKTVLIYTIGPDSSPEYSDFYAAQLFNKQNSEYFLKFVMPYDDVGEYIDVNPDIILSYEPVASPSDSSKYVDLMPYLNLDSATANDVYFANAIEAAKSGNSLYRMPLDISASGVITASSNVPEGQTGFTFDSYKKFLNNTCNGVDPISNTEGFRMDKAHYFTKLFMNMSDLFIKDGKVNFQGEDFRNLMTFVDEYGSDKNDDESYGIGSIGEHNRAVVEAEAEIEAAISGKSAEINGKLGAVYGNFYSFDNYISRYERFGSAMGIYGLPSYDGRGPRTVSTEYVSILADSKYADACAEYVKILLTYEVQCLKENNPINRKALRYIAEQKLENYNKQIDAAMKDDPSLKKAKLTDAAIDKYVEVLSSSYGGMSIGSAIESILIEESSAYFNGSKSMDDVIKVMQQRVQTVINESA